jgi:serine/threonine protein kinase
MSSSGISLSEQTRYFCCTRRNSDSDSEKILEEDLKILRDIGFDIRAEICRGGYGIVYHGFYTESAQYIKDKDGNELEATPGIQFACKDVNIKDRKEEEFSFATIRAFAQREKQYLTKLSNPYIVEFRMCINLGECYFVPISQDPFRPNDSLRVGPFYDRLYLFMDFADFGSLDSYLKRMSSKNLLLSEPQAKSFQNTLIFRHILIHFYLCSFNVYSFL